MIFTLLILPYFRSVQQTTLAVELVPVQQSYQTLEESVPKLFPEPRTDQISNYYWGLGIE